MLRSVPDLPVVPFANRVINWGAHDKCGAYEIEEANGMRKTYEMEGGVRHLCALLKTRAKRLRR